jgi:hypothetical protein
VLAFEHGNLLSKGKDFKGRVASALKENADNREHRQDEFTHEFSLVTRRNACLPTRWPMNLNLLIPRDQGVLSTGRHSL